MGRALGMERVNENFVLRLKSTKEDYIRNQGVDWINKIKMDLIFVPIFEGQFEPLIPNGNPA